MSNSNSTWTWTWTSTLNSTSTLNLVLLPPAKPLQESLLGQRQVLPHSDYEDGEHRTVHPRGALRIRGLCRAGDERNDVSPEKITTRRCKRLRLCWSEKRELVEVHEERELVEWSVSAGSIPNSEGQGTSK
jgi:hypothetical protein